MARRPTAGSTGFVLPGETGTVNPPCPFHLSDPIRMSISTGMATPEQRRDARTPQITSCHKPNAKLQVASWDTSWPLEARPHIGTGMPRTEGLRRGPMRNDDVPEMTLTGRGDELLEPARLPETFRPAKPRQHWPDQIVVCLALVGRAVQGDPSDVPLDPATRSSSAVPVASSRSAGPSIKGEDDHRQTGSRGRAVGHHTPEIPGECGKAAGTSVRAKSLPLNNKGSPVIRASA